MFSHQERNGPPNAARRRPRVSIGIVEGVGGRRSVSRSTLIRCRRAGKRSGLAIAAKGVIGARVTRPSARVNAFSVNPLRIRPRPVPTPPRSFHPWLCYRRIHTLLRFLQHFAPAQAKPPASGLRSRRFAGFTRHRQRYRMRFIALHIGLPHKSISESQHRPLHQQVQQPRHAQARRRIQAP